MVSMQKIIALDAVAGADVARSAWVLDAVLGAGGLGATEPWLALGLVLATGGLSLALVGIFMRAWFEQAPTPSS